MAKKIGEFQFRKLGGKGRPNSYPWGEWTDGSIWQVTRGEDFGIEPKMFAIGLYQKSRRIGKKVRAHINGDVVTFQFYTPEAKS